MFNINDIQRYACLKMEIFLKQPRDIVAEIDAEFHIYNSGYDFGKDEQYLIFYAMCEDILLRRNREFVLDIFTRAIKETNEDDIDILFRLKKLNFPRLLLIDVCVDILKGK